MRIPPPNVGDLKMQASSVKFAKALAERIAEILPPSLTIRADGAELDVYADGVSQGGSSAAYIVEDDDDRTLSERLETAARAVLDGVGDAVAEYLTLPWPADAEGGMAMPGARVDAERVHLWFGASEDAAAVTLRPIELGEIIDR
jgi:hypothetical protein